MRRDPMICPMCHVPMNYHAEKLIYSETPDPVLGGGVEEIHSCPNCGRTESRAAELD